MSMFCPKCGQANADRAQTCAVCGQPLSTTDPLRPVAGNVPLRPLNAPLSEEMPTLPVNVPPTENRQATPLNAPLTDYGAPTQPQPPSGGPPAPPVYSPSGPPPAAPYGTPAPVLQCRVCGTRLLPGDYQCRRCGAPVGTVANPNDPTSATYLPVSGAMVVENTSGQRGSVPPQIVSYRWSWGAFLLNWIWLLFHGMAWWGIAYVIITLLGLIPIIGVIFGLLGLCAQVYLGINGHKLAWQRRRYESVEQFNKVETAWRNWGIGLAIAGFVFFMIAMALLIPVFMQASMRAQNAARSRMYAPSGNYSAPPGNYR